MTACGKPQLSTVEAVERFIGLPGLFTRGQYDKYGAQWAARKLLQVIHAGKLALLQHCTVDTRDLPFAEAANDLSWRREITAAMIGWYVHQYDKSGDYLAAMRGMYTGYGDPVHRSESFGWNPLVDKLPGIYRVTWTTEELFNGVELPHIIDADQQWVTWNLLHFAMRHGYHVTIHEAWVFPYHTRVFTEYAALLWQARTALKAIGDTEASEKIKAIYTRGNGAWNWSKATHPSTDWIHSNWWADTIAHAKERRLANCLTYGPPLLIDSIDGMYFVSRDPNPATAVLDIERGTSILARAGESGGYKHVRSCQITQELYERAQGLEPAQLAKLVKEASRHGVQ